MKIEVATKKYFKEKKFIEETIEFPENIKELLDRAADLYPTALAINFFEQEPQAKSISYADLRVLVYKLADGLCQLYFGRYFGREQANIFRSKT